MSRYSNGSQGRFTRSTCEGHSNSRRGQDAPSVRIVGKRGCARTCAKYVAKTRRTVSACYTESTCNVAYAISHKEIINNWCVYCGLGKRDSSCKGRVPKGVDD